VTIKDVRATFRGWVTASPLSGLIKPVVVQERTSLENLVNMIDAFPTFCGGIGESPGAYGRGITKVLDPAARPMSDTRRNRTDGRSSVFRRWSECLRSRDFQLIQGIAEDLDEDIHIRAGVVIDDDRDVELPGIRECTYSNGRVSHQRNQREQLEY
jgi:hypothetical protein